MLEVMDFVGMIMSDDEVLPILGAAGSTRIRNLIQILLVSSNRGSKLGDDMIWCLSYFQKWILLTNVFGHHALR